MSAKPKNQNARKDPRERASTFLHMRVTKLEKRAWTRAASTALKRKRALAKWVRQVLNDRADEIKVA